MVSGGGSHHSSVGGQGSHYQPRLPSYSPIGPIDERGPAALPSTVLQDIYKARELQHLPVEALMQATEGWSADNLIGRGAFGDVYKGWLKDAGGGVAIKKLNKSD